VPASQDPNNTLEASSKAGSMPAPWLDRRALPRTWRGALAGHVGILVLFSAAGCCGHTRRQRFHEAAVVAALVRAAILARLAQRRAAHLPLPHTQVRLRRRAHSPLAVWQRQQS
jgi:hypothetical protein